MKMAEFYTVSEVAEVCGYGLTRIRFLLKRDDIRAFRRGAKLVYLKEDIHMWADIIINGEALATPILDPRELDL
jgi:hypothetical protein